MDATDIVREIEARVVGPTLLDGLLQMTYGLWSWPQFEREQQRVIDTANEFVLSSMFGVQQVDIDGVLIAQSGPFDANDPKSVYDAMVRQHRDFDLRMRADILVARCVDLLFVRHHPALFHIHEIVHLSPMVPAGHELSIARGFLAGINGDWLEAATYLIPQVEPLIRHLFQQHRIVTITMREDGTQEEKNLYELLGSAEAERVLSKDLILELNTLMIHPMGFRLRNVWAHGLATDQQLVSHGALALWWTLWRLILWPIALEQRGSDTKKEEN